MRTTYYMLDGHTPVPTEDAVEWGLWYQNSSEQRIVSRDGDEESGWWVSTVFLGLDHSFHGDGPPILFESLVFAGKPIAPAFNERWDGYMVRYVTWDQAAAGHREIVREIGRDLQIARA
jgi:hypothetical protein